MAATIIKVDTKKLTSTATSFQSTGNEIANLTKNMTNTVEALTGNIWSGDAAKAYVKKFNGLQNDIQKIAKMINEHVEDLTAIAKQYETSEETNIAAANALSDDVIV